MGAKTVRKTGKRGQCRGSGWDTMPGLVGKGGFLGCIWLSKYVRDCAVGVGWEGMDCGSGLGIMGGQCWPVPNPGGGPQIVERELGEDGVSQGELGEGVCVVRGWR